MLKTRLILSVLILGIMVGGSALWTSDIHNGWKVLATVPGGFLYVSAIVLLAITFFALENGYLPQNSLAYWYFSRFYKVREKTLDGKEVEVLKMPEHLRLCPAYWMLVLGIMWLSIAVAGLSLVIVMVGYGIYYGLTVGYAMTSVIGFFYVLGVVAALAGFLALAVYLGCRSKNFFLQVIGCLMMIVFSVGLLWGLPTSVYMKDYGMSFGQAGTKAAVGLGVGLGWAVGIILGLSLVIAGVIWLAYRIFPWVKNSIVGRIFSALYHNLCPMIPVEASSDETAASALSPDQ